MYESSDKIIECGVLLLNSHKDGGFPQRGRRWGYLNKNGWGCQPREAMNMTEPCKDAYSVSIQAKSLVSSNELQILEGSKHIRSLQDAALQVR